MNHKQQALRMRFSPRSESYIWLRNSENKDLLPGDQLATPFKEPTNLGLCAVEIPDPPDGLVYCDNLEEADWVYCTAIFLGDIHLDWYPKHCLDDYDLVFAYAKHKPEAREEYLKRTVPEGYEWVGRGSTGKKDRLFLGKMVYESGDGGKDWADAATECYHGGSEIAFYIRKSEQPKPEFDPQAGSKWEHKNGGVFTIEQLDSGKYLLLSPGSLYLFAPAAHCIKDAFGGREAEFKEIKD